MSWFLNSCAQVTCLPLPRFYFVEGKGESGKNILRGVLLKSPSIHTRSKLCMPRPTPICLTCPKRGSLRDIAILQCSIRSEDGSCLCSAAFLLLPPFSLNQGHGATLSAFMLVRRPTCCVFLHLAPPRLFANFSCVVLLSPPTNLT